MVGFRLGFHTLKAERCCLFCGHFNGVCAPSGHFMFIHVQMPTKCV